MPAAKIRSSIERTLGISPSGVRRLLRYDVEGLTERQMRDSVESVFSEPNTDRVFYDVRVGRDEKCSSCSSSTGSTTSAPIRQCSACSF